jgi:hypothetical protein
MRERGQESYRAQPRARAFPASLSSGGRAPSTSPPVPEGLETFTHARNTIKLTNHSRSSPAGTGCIHQPEKPAAGLADRVGSLPARGTHVMREIAFHGNSSQISDRHFADDMHSI